MLGLAAHGFELAGGLFLVVSRRFSMAGTALFVWMWFVGQGCSMPPPAFLGTARLGGVPTMKELIELFNSCDNDLRVIRSQLSDNHEPSIRALLDSVILRLEQGVGAIRDTESGRVLSNDLLVRITRFIEALAAISDFFDRFPE